MAQIPKVLTDMLQNFTFFNQEAIISVAIVTAVKKKELHWWEIFLMLKITILIMLSIMSVALKNLPRNMGSISGWWSGCSDYRVDIWYQKRVLIILSVMSTKKLRISSKTVYYYYVSI